jgi:voltage-gated sodium channel
VTSLARRIVDAPKFQLGITLVILFAGVLVGLETDAHIVARYGTVLHALDRVVLGLFVLEIALKMLAEGKAPQRYFLDRWNVFDFVIVALCFVPMSGQYVTVLRLLRLLRVLRLLHAFPKLQLLVSALLHSIPSMGYVAMFLGLLFYVYGVAAVFLFGAHDPMHFGNLGASVLSLFTVVTLEGWAELMYTQMEVYPLASPLFFVSFVLIGTMIVLNLFIGVIMNSMQEASAELERAQEQIRIREREALPPTLEHELFELQRAMHELSERMILVQRRAAAALSKGS